jgi:hypothetical protein
VPPRRNRHRRRVPRAQPLPHVAAPAARHATASCCCSCPGPLAARATARAPRLGLHRRFRYRGTEYVSESGMKWMRGSTKRQCDNATYPRRRHHRRRPRAPTRGHQRCSPSAWGDKFQSAKGSAGQNQGVHLRGLRTRGSLVPPDPLKPLVLVGLEGGCRGSSMGCEGVLWDPWAP